MSVGVVRVVWESGSRDYCTQIPSPQTLAPEAKPKHPEPQSPASVTYVQLSTLEL